MASETNPIVTKPWYRRPGGIARFLLLMLALVFVVWRVHLAFSVRARLRALHEAGHPITLAELEQLRYAPIAGETNGAVFFNQAIALSHLTNSTSRELYSLFWTNNQFIPNAQFFSAQYQEKLTALLNENREVLDLLHKYPPKTRSRFPIEWELGYRANLPHLHPLKVLVQLLTLQAASHVYQNEMEAAMADLDAAFKIADSFAEEPLVISHLVSQSSRTEIVDGVGRLLSHRTFSDEQLRQLSDAFHKREFPESLSHALEGELCCGCQLFQMPVRDLIALARDENVQDPAPEPRPGVLRGFAGSIIMNWSGFRGRDFRFFLDIMSEDLAVAKIGFPERLSVADELGQRALREAGKYLYITSRLILPAISRLHQNEAADIARAGIIQTVLAVERHRLTHQDKLPDQLAELTPNLLPSIPADPFSGGTLHYKKLPVGYVVYSVGRNRIDDGGIGKTHPKPGAPDDIILTVER